MDKGLPEFNNSPHLFLLRMIFKVFRPNTACKVPIRKNAFSKSEGVLAAET